MAKLIISVAAALYLLGVSQAFVPTPRMTPFVRRPFLFSSRFEGNQREPDDSEIKVMDEMINKMADAKPYELPNAVRRAFRVCSSPQFFLRIAELADTNDEAKKDKLSTLATNLAATIEAVVSTMTDQLDERAQDVEAIVATCAEPESGEFLVPLTFERVTAMREALEKMDDNKLDESFLTTVDSWIVKSHQDGMDGMVEILQKVLQQYAGINVSRARAVQVAEEVRESPASQLFEKLMTVDPELWDYTIKNGVSAEVTSFGLIAEIQRTMEAVVLGLENGSMAQRIQAEYLKELVTRVEALQEQA